MALPTRPPGLPEEELPATDAKKAAAAELYKQIKDGALDAARFSGTDRSRALRDYAYAYRLLAGGQQPGSVPESR